MPSAERKLPKYAAIAAPILLFAANACSENKTQTPSPTQQPTLGGQVKPEVITPALALTPTTTVPGNVESFDPNEGKVSVDGQVSIDTLIDTLNTLESSLPANLYESLINRYQGIKTASVINPTDQQVAYGLNQTVDILDGICSIPGVKKLKTETAAYMSRNFPQNYQNAIGAWETGNCAVEAQTEQGTIPPASSAENHTGLEPYIDRHGFQVHTTFRGNYAYTYTLVPEVDLPLVLPNIISTLENPEYIGKANDPQTFSSVKEKLQKIISLELADPNDPEILNLLLQSAKELGPECDSNFFIPAIVKNNSAALNQKNPGFWQEHQFELLDSNCLDAKKYIISPEFPIEPRADGTFIYKGVTYEDLLAYAQNLRSIYPRDSQTIINWLQYAADNRNNYQEESTGQNSATFILLGGCKDNDVAFNTIRLAESVIMENNPDIQDYYPNRLRACYMDFFDDPYFFER